MQAFLFLCLLGISEDTKIREARIMDTVINGNYDQAWGLVKDLNTESELRKRVCKRLVEVINNGKSGDRYQHTPKNVALYVLSQFADYDSPTEVISALVENVNTGYKGTPSSRTLLPERKFPPLSGLIKIGRRATSLIVEKIKKTDDERLHNLFAYWFHNQYGRRLSQVFLEDLLQDNPKMPLDERKRLVKVLETIENTFKDE